MKGRRTVELVNVGAEVRYLLHAAVVGTPAHGSGFIIANARNFLKDLENLSLVVTLAATPQLTALVERWEARPVDHTLDRDEARELADAMNKIEHTLLAETSTLTAYIVTPKRMDIARLVNNVSGLIGEGVFAKLPQLAQFDLSEAGKCIAFERSTAAAFHLLRATEEVLRNFYCSVVRRKRMNPMLWGPMVEQLRRRRSPPALELLNHLDHIRSVNINCE